MDAMERKYGVLEILLDGNSRVFRVEKLESEWKYSFGEKNFSNPLGPEELSSSILQKYKDKDIKANLYWITNHK